jgi:peptide/nickel transport system permease protein
MFNYLVKRLLWVIPTLLGVMLFLFSLTYMLPGDPISILLGPRATPELIASTQVRLHLNDPIYLQLFYFLFGVVKGDLGYSVWSGYQVRSLIAQALPHTLILTLFSLGIAAVVGILLGCFASVYNEDPKGFIITIASLLCVAIPDFVWALLLLLLFCVRLLLLPTIGAGAPGDLLDILMHLILPSTALCLPWIGYFSRLTQESMKDILRSDYIRTAKAFAIPNRVIIYKYALKNAVIPSVTVLGMAVGKLLAGAVFVEIIFNRPGMGKLIIDAVYQRDLPVIQGAILVVALLFVLSNIISDISYSFLNPQVRYD